MQKISFTSFKCFFVLFISLHPPSLPHLQLSICIRRTCKYIIRKIDKSNLINRSHILYLIPFLLHKHLFLDWPIIIININIRIHKEVKSAIIISINIIVIIIKKVKVEIKKIEIIITIVLKLKSKKDKSSGQNLLYFSNF